MFHETSLLCIVRRSILALFCLVIWTGYCTTPLWAESYNGEIESIDIEEGRLTLKPVGKGAARTFRFTKSVSVTKSGKKTELAEVEIGSQVTITADAKFQASRILLKPQVAASKGTPRDSGKKEKDESSGDGNWSQYRGPNRDGRSSETGLLKKWPEGGPKTLWNIAGLGEGYSSLSHDKGVLYTLGTKGDEEQLVAIQLRDGEKLWSRTFGKYRSDGQGGGPRGTPTIDGDRVYALGAEGDLVCVKVQDGTVEWSLNILREFDGPNIVWGISESVLIDGDQLICTPGGRKGTMVALKKRTGEVIWKCQAEGAPKAAYSSAIVAEVGGVRQYINYVHSGLMGVDAATGTPLWGDNSSANPTANCSSPLFGDGFVFSASGYDTGGSLLRLNPGKTGVKSTVVYKTKEMKNHHGGMVIHEGYLYGTSDPGILKCLQVSTGKVQWENRSVGKGSVIFADGHLIVRSERGPVALVEANSKSYIEKGRFEQLDRSSRPSWAHPVIAEGKLFLRDGDRLMSYSLTP